MPMPVVCRACRGDCRECPERYRRSPVWVLLREVPEALEKGNPAPARTKRRKKRKQERQRRKKSRRR